MSAEDDFYVVRTIGGLRGADERSEEAIGKFGLGEIVRIKFYSSRNIKHHRLFFGLLNMVFKNQEKYLSVEALRFAVTVCAGFVDEIHLDGDRVAFKPRSLAFSSMGQREFEDFYTAALQAIPRLLPQFAGIDLERELAINSTGD